MGQLGFLIQAIWEDTWLEKAGLHFAFMERRYGNATKQVLRLHALIVYRSNPLLIVYRSNPLLSETLEIKL